MAARTTLVTGATGLVGRRLTASLRRDDRSVRVVSRNTAASGFGDDVEALAWNGRSLAAEVLFRVGDLVHLAGEPIFGGRLTAKRRRRIRASRIDSTRSIVEALGALPEADRPACFVCASAVGYYGSRGDERLAEDATAGAGFLAQVCADWEAAALAATELGIRTVCLRIGIVLAREGGALPRLALPFRLGLGGRVGDGSQWFPWIHNEDLVAIVRAALDDERHRGAVNAVAPVPVTNAEFTHTLGRVLHRPTLVPVPAFAVRVALGELSDEVLGSRRVVPQALEERGFSFAHREIESALLAELDAN